MSRTNYEKDRIRKASQFEKDFDKRTAALKSALYREVLSYLNANMKTDKDGRVLFNVSNIRASNNVFRTIQNFAKRTGTKLIKWLINRLSDLFKTNSNYFRSFLEYPGSRDERALRKLMLQLGFDNSTNRILKGGFFSRVFQLDGIASNIARDIQQALASRLTLSAFRKLFKQRFESAKYVEKWFRRFTGDLFHQFDASAQEVLSNDLGLLHFVYAGTAIKKTRCFCERRLNRIYTKDFAGKWNNLDWKGKIPGTDFFVDRGGYNCRHHLSYITENRAERVSNQRGFKIDSYNETDCNDERKS